MLRIENLTKMYPSLTAVDSLNLEVEAGDIMGFIGPNGAGKTTTIRMISTLLQATSGKIYIDGMDITEHTDEVRSLIGYMPDFFGLYEDVKVWEYLDFFASAYKLPKEKRLPTIKDVLELTDLSAKYEAMVSELSRGMQQRLCLAKTILHDPKLLLLDEPASGLDPRARIEIRELLKELRRMGKTILISSHILPELADFCNKIAVIEQGRLVVSGDVEEIMRKCRGGLVLKIRLAERVPEAIALLKTTEFVSEVTTDEEGSVMATYIGEDGTQHNVLQSLVSNGFKVIGFEEARVDLQDVFMQVTKGLVS